MVISEACSEVSHSLIHSLTHLFVHSFIHHASVLPICMWAALLARWTLFLLSLCCPCIVCHVGFPSWWARVVFLLQSWLLHAWLTHKAWHADGSNVEHAQQHWASMQMLSVAMAPAVVQSGLHSYTCPTDTCAADVLPESGFLDAVWSCCQQRG